MASRIDLQRLLENILGSTQVYFQPPESIKLTYPAIIYSRSKINNRHADDMVYLQHKAYTITVIDPNPDSAIVDNISKLPMCRFVQHFTSENLNHDVFTIYY